MGGERHARRRRTVMALAIPFGVMLGSTTAFADSSGGQTTFASQYQSNATVESTLLQSFAAKVGDTSAGRSRYNHIQRINARIARLYDTEQQLAAEVTALPAATATSDDNQQDDNLAQERQQWLNQLQTLWHQTFGTQQGFPADGGSDETLLVWLDQNGTSSFDPAVIHGRGHVHGMQPIDSQAWKKFLNKANHVIHQIENLDAKQQTDRAHHGGHGRGHHHGDGGGNDNGDGDRMAALQERLQDVQAEILGLQATAIHDLQSWVSSLQPPTNATITGVTLSPSATSVQEGGSVTFVAQLVGTNGEPIHTAGTTLDFAFVGGNTDGALSTASASTNATGQASVVVAAGNSPGAVQVSARVDGTSVENNGSAVVQVVPIQAVVATRLVSAGVSFPSSLEVGQSTDATSSVYPETAGGQVVAGDVLQVTTSNPGVLALRAPNTGTDNVQTLPAGQYELPSLTAKATGTAVVLVTDLTAPTRPSLSYTVNVVSGTAIALQVVNPNGTINTPYGVGAGVDGPFAVTVVNAAGAPVPAPSNLVLTAAQVNQLIGAGTGIRPANASNDVQSVQIPAGQSSVTVYADGVVAGNTSPRALPLSGLTPALIDASVRDASSIVLTYNEGLSTNSPMLGDFWIDWGNGGSSTPETVTISGNTVTLKMWGAPLAHGEAITLSYVPLSTDANPLKSIFGTEAASFKSITVNNSL